MLGSSSAGSMAPCSDDNGCVQSTQPHDVDVVIWVQFALAIRVQRLALIPLAHPEASVAWAMWWRDQHVYHEAAFASLADLASEDAQSARWDRDYYIRFLRSSLLLRKFTVKGSSCTTRHKSLRVSEVERERERDTESVQATEREGEIERER